MVNCSASSPEETSGFTNSRSQFSLNFILGICKLICFYVMTDAIRHHYSPLLTPYSSLSTELPQEANIVIEEQAQVVDAVLQHRQALNPHAEGEAAVFTGVYADVL